MNHHPLQQLALLVQLQGLTGVEAQYARKGRLTAYQYAILMHCCRIQLLALPNARHNIHSAIIQIRCGNLI